MYELLRNHFNKYVGLSDEEFEHALSFFKFRKFRRHQFVLQEGDISKYENYIVKGCTRTYETDDKGQEHIIQFGIEDWWVGDMYSFLTNTPSLNNIICIEDCEILQISADNHEKMCDSIPKLEKHFRKLIQNAYVASTRRIYSNLSKPALERYHEFLDRYPQLGQRIPNNYIASYLGITPQSLSRLRAANR